MSKQRLSAKEAIEALKAYQLSKVTAGVSEEIKALREEVKNWNNHVDETRNDVNELRVESKEVQQTVHGHERTLLQLESGLTNLTKELRTMQQLDATLDERISKLRAASDAMRLHNESTTGILSEKVAELSNKIRSFEDIEVQAVRELHRDVTNRTGEGIVKELEDKLEDFIQEVDTRFEGLQHLVRVPDSFASSHNHQPGERHPVDNASPLTAPAHSPSSPRQDSDSGRWRPIDFQTALQATPPPLPETLPLVIHREDTDVQTPSTFRSTALTRPDISNIVHTRPPPVKNATQILPQKLPLTISAGVSLKQHNGPVEPGSKQNEIDWTTLNGLLKLRQKRDQSLTEYFASFQTLAAKLHSDHGIVSACLRRFVNGIVDNRQKDFVREWLMTSDWTVENIQDCMLLITKYSGSVNTGQADTDLVRDHVDESTQAQRHDSGTDLVHHNLACSDLDDKTHAVALFKVQSKDQLPQRNKTRPQRIQPSRTAKTQTLEKVPKTKARNSKISGKINGVTNTNSQHRTNEGPAPVKEPAAQDGTASVAEIVEAQPDAVTQKKSHKSTCKKELRSLLNTRRIEKPVHQPLTPQKRKTLHQVEDDTAQETLDNQLAQRSQDSPPSRPHLHLKRIPKLVARNVSQAARIPDTSDAVKLPPMHVGIDGEERNDVDTGSVARKRARKASPEIPILSLSPSDLQG